MILKPDQLSARELYRVLITAVAPRPIAWVSTISADGTRNLAPFSFFNAISSQPPLLAFAPILRAAPGEVSARPKDTLHNIRATGEFVVATVTRELAEAMNLTSGEYPPDVDEFTVAGLEMRPASLVRPGHVAQSPVNFECKLFQILDFGVTPPSGSLVIGEILAIAIDDACLREGKLDGDLLDLVGRLGGNQYTTTRDRFVMDRPGTRPRG